MCCVRKCWGVSCRVCAIKSECTKVPSRFRRCQKKSLSDYYWEDNLSRKSTVIGLRSQVKEMSIEKIIYQENLQSRCPVKETEYLGDHLSRKSTDWGASNRDHCSSDRVSRSSINYLLKDLQDKSGCRQSFEMWWKRICWLRKSRTKISQVSSTQLGT